MKKINIKKIIGLFMVFCLFAGISNSLRNEIVAEQPEVYVDEISKVASKENVYETDSFTYTITYTVNNKIVYDQDEIIIYDTFDSDKLDINENSIIGLQFNDVNIDNIDDYVEASVSGSQITITVTDYNSYIKVFDTIKIIISATAKEGARDEATNKACFIYRDSENCADAKVTISEKPRISTKVSYDGRTGKPLTLSEEEAVAGNTIVDTITYNGFEPGEYYVDGSIFKINQDTGLPDTIVAICSAMVPYMTIKDSSGQIQVNFVLDKDLELGQKYVIYECVIYDKDMVYAKHEAYDDLDQQILVKNPETTEIVVKKVWEGDEDVKDTVRPSKVTVNLYQDDELYATCELTEENKWENKFEDLPVYVEDSETKYVYTVEEEIIDNYKTTVTGNETDGFTITNKYVEKPKPTPYVAPKTGVE